MAGLSTGVGSCIAVAANRTDRKFLSVSLGFSAGVMIYVSLVEILDKALDTLAPQVGDTKGSWLVAAAFFGGMLLIAVMDKVIPTDRPLKESTAPTFDQNQELCPTKLLRTGLFTASAIAIHNFPEGLATFISALREPAVAIPVVAAIAIHNVPEGIAVSVPIYQATGSRKKAFFYSLLSGLAEPVGALVGWFLLMPVMNDIVLGVIFAGVAGIMVFISFDELLPSSRDYGKHHLSLYGLISGMAVMAVSLLLL